MIRFTVSPPKERWQAIQQAVNLLEWNKDKYFQQYGLKVSPEPTTVKGRVLDAPNLKFGSRILQPTDINRGRWRIDGTKFIYPNPRPLKAWGICVVRSSGRGSADPNVVRQFMERFVSIYEGHGGVFDQASRRPVIVEGNLSDGGEMMTKVWNETGNHYKMKPQLLIFIVNDRNAQVYHRIKKSCECRYGVVSQVMQAEHVVKMNPQYISNVLMKVNAKLGGATSQAVSNILPKMNPQRSRIPTMCIGADVSHPPPANSAEQDGTSGSYAAITVSMNPSCTRYAALVDTNGYRVEMVETKNWDTHLSVLVRQWMQTIGGARVPQHVYYFRDGVADGQYAHVLQQEVVDIKAVFKKLDPKSDVKMVVIIGSKRHHIRFFPEKGDRNGNPFPGTLIETGVTHPFEFDFYLCSHSAIKGTARPAHYHVLLNEPKVDAAELQQFIYESSYHYMRSTTPISQFPAIYYAHLASQRAKAHENNKQISSGKKETAAGDIPKASHTSHSSTSDKTPTEVLPLLEMNNSQGINFAMWYI
jgi:eukaryotic translation initiation factor 2C